MLVKYKERHILLFRAVSLAVVGLFLLSDISFALAPKLGLNQSEIEDGFFARSFLLTSDIAHRYAVEHINPKLFRDEDDGRIVIKGVKDFLKNVGQIAQIDIDSISKKPVIYVDTNYFYNDTVAKFETDKINALLDVWRLKKGKCESLAKWVLEYRFKNDPDLGGKTSREIADGIHSGARQRYPGVDRLYDKIRSKYKRARDQARAESLLNFASMYAFYRQAGYLLDRDDKKGINFAAHEEDASSVKVAADPVDSSKDDSPADQLHRQLIAANWIDENIPELKGKTVFSLSMEGNIPEFDGYEARNANTKGGLGAYFGDKLEGMADIGINAFGAQIGYSHIRKDGKKVRVSYDELIKRGILKPVLVGDDALSVRAWDEDPEARTEDDEDRYNPKVKVEVYKVNRGGATDYIFMSKVFDELYPEDGAHRFTQEIVFGKAVYAFMKKTGFKPDILHLNEAHTVVAAAQMRSDEAYNQTSIVYTNHTIVPDGLEIFHPDRVRSDINRMMYVIGIPRKKAARFRSAFLRPNGVVDFCYAAIKLADVITAVSHEHALATKKLFQTMYEGEFNAEVVGVLNGSGQSWKSDNLKSLEASGRVPNAADAWSIHEQEKARAFIEIEKMTGVKLDPAKLTAWLVRRLVEYKSQYPMLKFIVHLMTADRTRAFTKEELRDIWFRDITNLRQDYERNYLGTRDVAENILNRLFPAGTEKVNGLGMQIVIGWPPPAYQGFWAYEFSRWMELPDLKGRFVVVQSDADVLKMQATGADICITMPRPLKEACGTSDQRTGLNFGVNIAIDGAGPGQWIESYNEENETGNGFLASSYVIGDGEEAEEDKEKFYKDAPADIFTKAAICSHLFYEDGKDRWKRLMLNSYLGANKSVTAVAMEQRYARDVYLPAVRKRRNTKTIYEVALRDHYDGNTGLSGLRASMKELPYLAESGVKYIYLLGLMDNTGAPFEIVDPNNIDRYAGSFEDLDEYMRRAHKLGLMVVMDG